ncbi:hypothetical protein ACFJIW_12000 [Tahibacter sp. UC22_41]|uniref:hypothetical protein n=1 Tax=Tahibacter sp. UC22_41 TaxID=3350178 RepID=UPI0036D8AA92
MLFPENPARKPQLWTELKAQLAEHPVCLLVANGTGNPTAKASLMSEQTASALLSRLQNAHVCRISANRGCAISPHFAGQVAGDVLLITELVLLPSSDREVSPNFLTRELETAAINLFCTEKYLSEVRAPLSLASWKMSDAEITQESDGLHFKKVFLR